MKAYIVTSRFSSWLGLDALELPVWLQPPVREPKRAHLVLARCGASGLRVGLAVPRAHEQKSPNR
jgi:hypothetical protein